MAVFKGKIKIGIRKLKVNPEIERKVKNIVNQISCGVCLAFPSSISISSLIICKLMESDSPSAIAIMIIPAIIVNFEVVLNTNQ